MVAKLAGLLHEESRALRQKADGTFEPDIKKTDDEKWQAFHGSKEVDLSSTSFEDLPVDWQKENRLAAQVVLDEIFRAVVSGQKLDEKFVEKASAVIHEKWLAREMNQAQTKQKELFADLTEEEKEKDRVQIRKAIELFESKK